MFKIFIFSGSGSYSPQPNVTNTTKNIGPTLENALLRAPLLQLQAGKTQAAINRYR